MPAKSPLKLRILRNRLKKYGIVEKGKSGSGKGKRGKGSEIIFLKPTEDGSNKGPMYPVKDHGARTEISSYVIDRILERFNEPI